MQPKYIIIFALAATFSISSNAEILIGTMGCESLGTEKFENKENVFILLYGDQEGYTKICRDNIGNSSMDAMECFPTEVNALKITSDTWRTTYNYRIQIDLTRKDLKLILRSRSSSYGYYQCTKSKNPQSVENFVKNAKQNQLSSNQF